MPKQPVVNAEDLDELESAVNNLIAPHEDGRMRLNQKEYKRLQELIRKINDWIRSCQ